MRKRSKSRRKQRKSIVKIFFKYFVYSGFCSIVALFLILLYFARDLPDLQNLKTEIRNPSVVIQTYDGNIIGSYGDLYEDVIKVKDLPQHVPAAFMAVEDKRFFSHFGIDFIGFFRAAYNNYVSRRVVQGGSTITQQLAKNILIGEGIVSHYDRSIKRKIRELLLALWLEHKFSKTDIMMMYLNRVYFGAGTYGIDAASRKYFDKPAKYLTIFESAVLAGILKAPSKYSPTNHPNYAYERACLVLSAMEEQGFIKSAKEIENTQGKNAFKDNIKHNKCNMYFCDYAYEEAKKILGEIGDDIIVVTTFSAEKQKIAEEAVKYYIDTESENYNFSQAAFICLGRNGAIQALIGGKDYTATQFNRATQAIRMPGSAFKLFIYGAALEYGYQPSDMISDAPIEIAGWKPKNYKWNPRGAISILESFSYSVNSVSIRLAQTIGLPRIANFAKKLGIYNVSCNDLSVALGTTPVTLKDLTSAYASFMDGNSVWTYCILEIRAKDGKVLYQQKEPLKVPIFDKELLDSIRTLLRSVVSIGGGRAANVNNYIYGKTGTNGDWDAWFIGFYDPADNKKAGVSIGVWIGNDNNKIKMTPNSTGGRIPARICARFLTNLLDKNKKESMPTALSSYKSLGDMLLKE
ncbi:MAG: transglycosylase domain-containing protein [Holosporales bacterium]|nr:transglycosylase domain-containing protein [Holosporales bacterium]